MVARLPAAPAGDRESRKCWEGATPLDRKFPSTTEMPPRCGESVPDPVSPLSSSPGFPQEGPILS